MSFTFEQIKAEAMKLSPEERTDLAAFLWVSASPREEVEAAWEAEIDAGTVELIPSEQVLAEITEKIRKAGG